MIIFIILIISLILRLIAINQSLWLDEAVQVWLSANFSLRSLIAEYMPGDFNPPLYHLMTHFWVKIFGTSEFAVRLLPIILSLLSIYVFYKILREMRVSSPLRRIVTLLLATSPLHIYYSQENRMYMLACLGFSLVLWRFLIFMKKINYKNMFLFTLSLLIMSFSHYLTLFTLPIFFVFGIKKLKSKKIFILPFFILGITYLIYLPLLLKQLQIGLSWTNQFPVWGNTVGSFSLKSALLLPVKFIIGRINITNKIIYAVISLILIILYWGLVFRSFIKLRVTSYGSLVTKLFFFPIIISFLISFKIPIFSYFRFLFLIPIFYLLIGFAIKNNKKLGFLLIGLNLIFSFIYLLNSNFHRENWKDMTVYLHNDNINNNPVIILSQINKPFLYYDKNKTQIISDPQNINSEAVYLINYSLPIFDPDDRIRQSLIDNRYKLIDIKNFRRVGVEKWEVSN